MNKKQIFMFFVVCVCIVSQLYACRVAISNDTQYDFQVEDHNDNSLIVINPGQMTSFGDAHIKAKFSLFRRNNQQVYVLVAKYLQKKCAAETTFTIQELLNANEKITDIFTVTFDKE